MSTQATHLPSEILFKIFKDTNRETQIHLQSVCKAWYFPARQVFFNTIHLKDKLNVSQLVYCLQSAGHLVNSLKIDHHTALCKQGLIALISTCPELQDLQVYSDSRYFQWLLQEKIVLDRLKFLRLMGRVSWRSNETNACYYRVAHKYSHHLEKLEIILTCSAVFQQEFGGFLNYLASFKLLKQLVIMDGSRNVMVYFDQLLNTCRGLQKLKIDLGHPLVDPALKPSSEVYPSMRHIEMFMAKFSTDYFEYLMYRFVNLSELHVRINQSATDWEDEKKEIIPFMKHVYLPYIRKQLSHSSLLINMQAASCIGDSFADFTQVNKDSVIDALFEVHDGRHQRTVVKLDTKGNNTLAHYTFVRDFSSTEVFELPFRKHLVTYGKNVQKLRIHISNSVSRSIDFGLILDQCPSTRFVELSLAPMFPRDCSWNDMMQVFNSTPNVYLNNGSSSNTALSTVKLDGAMVTPCLLTRMAKQTPKLQELSLINCTFFMDTQEEITQFDMSNLDLKRFSFDVKWFYHRSQHHTCFAISSAGKKRFYSLDRQEDIFSEIETADDVDVEFVFGTVQSIQVHVGKFAKRQRIQVF